MTQSFQCIASNEVKGELMNETKTVNFSVNSKFIKLVLFCVTLLIYFQMKTSMSNMTSLPECCEIRPENLAAVAGQNISLNYRPSEFAYFPSLSWKEFITHPYGRVIFTGNVSSNPPNKEIYSLLMPEERDYNLGIQLLNISGGGYGCEMLAPYHDMSLVNVIVFGKFICY